MNRNRIVVLAIAAVAMVACQTETVPEPSSTVSAPTTPSSAPASDTSVADLPAGAGVEVVAPCEATDEIVVAAPVAPLGGRMVATEDAVWVSSFATGGVIRIEPDTMCPDEPLTLPGAALGVASLAVGPDGTLYAGVARDGGVLVVSPDDHSVEEFPVDVQAGGGLAVVDDHLWAVCCEAGTSGGGGGVYDIDTGEAIATFEIGAGAGVAVEDGIGYVGRREVAGMYRVTVEDGEASVDELSAFGATTYQVVAGPSGAFMIGDEPVIQRAAADVVEQYIVVPFPRERQSDLALGDDGALFTVTPFGPGLVYVTPDGEPYALVGGEDFVEVEVVGNRAWVLTTGGVLLRVDLSGLLDG